MSSIHVTNVKDASGNAALVTESGGVKTDKLTGITTAGSISVVGEGNSTTTNLQQGLIKVWDHVSGDGATIDDSFNISSHTDTGTGQGYHVFTNNMSNNDWSRMALNQWSDFATGNGAYAVSIGNADTTSQFRTLHYENAGLVDPQERYIMVAGDLA